MRRRFAALAAVLALTAFACGGGDDDSSGPDPTAAPPPPAASGDAANGETLYGGTCIGCHGPDATGIDGLGKSLVGSEFVNRLSDSELVDFLIVGRPTSDPLNTTGVDMLPRGGNPSLDDGDLLDIVAFIRTLN
jgi:disulfide bond formation protein DsbB